MDAQLKSMLNETEQALLRAAEPRELNRLDEDELAGLHDRIRRARNKYSKLYRRRASERVNTDRSRGRASSANAKAARKAEGFEDALARVSHKLAQVAAAAAEELKAERLAAARRTPVPASKPKGSTKKRSTATNTSARGASRSPASEKKRASTKASNKRNQAARDRRS
ncbi:MAG TPA: hypothetical protein VES40_20830 [Ilumatobacteraceae bacterium]|nr:hypothetical protein [Ilumatobacteraceae bacterium]